VIVLWEKIICDMRKPGRKYAEMSENSTPMLLTIQQHLIGMIVEAYIKSTREKLM
jgi:hypothetical protein